MGTHKQFTMDESDSGTTGPIAVLVRKKHTQSLLKYLIILICIFFGMGLFLFFVPWHVQAQVSGKVECFHSISVVAPSKGRIKELLVPSGQSVLEGQPLAILERTDLPERLAGASEDLARYKEEIEILGILTSALTEPEEDLDSRHRERIFPERSENLQSRLEKAMHDAEKRVALCMESTTQVLSPIHGVLAEWLCAPGDMIDTEEPLGRIFKNDCLWIDVQIPENEISQVKVGQEVDIRFATKPWREHGVFKGIVSQIGTTVQPMEEKGGLFCSIGILVNNPPADVKEGSTVDVRIKTNEGSSFQRLFRRQDRIG